MDDNLGLTLIICCFILTLGSCVTIDGYQRAQIKIEKIKCGEEQ